LQLLDARISIGNILQILPAEYEHILLDQLVRNFNERQTKKLQSVMTCDVGTDCGKKLNNETDATCLERTRSGNSCKKSGSTSQRGEITKQPVSADASTANTCKDSNSFQIIDKCTNAINRLEALISEGLVNSANHKMSSSNNSESIMKVNSNSDRRSKTNSSGIGTPLAHSTPKGTLMKFSTSRYQINTIRKRKRKRRKLSRWNFAARLCSSRLTALSDSDSMESSIYLQATNTQMIRQPSLHQKHKRRKWFFRKTNKNIN